MYKLQIVCAIILLVGAVSCGSAPEEVAEPTLAFEYSEVDPGAAGRIAIGDIDADGHNDIVLHTWSTNRGKDSDGTVTWYRYPDWTRSVIKGDDHIFGDGVVAVDLDGDKDLDVVTAKGNDASAQVWWFENPGGAAREGWKEFQIAEVETGSEVKDVYVHDMDHDGKQDVVVRTKHFFTVYFQEEPRKWTERKMDNAEREGMTLGDLDGDGDYDAVMNGYWRENPADPRTGDWARHDIDEQWFNDVTGGWQDHSVRTAVADFNGDGKKDVAYSHSEKTGYAVTWYESGNPKGGQEAWTKHPIEVVDYCHTLAGGDVDNDGDLDLLTATLKRKETPQVLLFLNDGKGVSWERMEVAAKSAYKARLSDIDDDGDLDILTSASWEDPPIMLWRNQLK